MKKPSDGKILKEVLQFLKKVCKGLAISVAVVAAWQIAAGLGISTLGIILTCVAGSGVFYFGSKLVKKFNLKKVSQVTGKDEIEEEKGKNIQKDINKKKKAYSKINKKLKGIFKLKNQQMISENLKKTEEEKKIQENKDEVEDVIESKTEVPENLEVSSLLANDISKNDENIKNDVNDEVLKFENVNLQQDKSHTKGNFENNRCDINQYRNVHYKDDYDFRQKYQYKGVKKDKNVAVVTDYDRRLNLTFNDVCMAYLSVFDNHQVMIILRKDGSTNRIEDSRLFENVFASLVANENDKNYSKMSKTEALSELSKQGLYRFVPYNMIYQIKQKPRGKYQVTYCSGESISINEEKLNEYLNIMCRDYQMDEMQLCDYKLYTKITQKKRVRK